MFAPRNLSLFFVPLGIVMLAACGFPKGGEVPAPTTAADAVAANARWPNSSGDALAAGRAAFVARCNGCHGYPDVRSVDDAEWPVIMKRMAKKAGLDAPAAENVLHFVLVARARP